MEETREWRVDSSWKRAHGRFRFVLCSLYGIGWGVLLPKFSHIMCICHEQQPQGLYNHPTAHSMSWWPTLPMKLAGVTTGGQPRFRAMGAANDKPRLAPHSCRLFSNLGHCVLQSLYFLPCPACYYIDSGDMGAACPPWTPTLSVLSERSGDLKMEIVGRPPFHAYWEMPTQQQGFEVSQGLLAIAKKRRSLLFSV